MYCCCMQITHPRLLGHRSSKSLRFSISQSIYYYIIYQSRMLSNTVALSHNQFPEPTSKRCEPPSSTCSCSQCQSYSQQQYVRASSFRGPIPVHSMLSTFLSPSAVGHKIVPTNPFPLTKAQYSSPPRQFSEFSKTTLVPTDQMSIPKVYQYGLYDMDKDSCSNKVVRSSSYGVPIESANNILPLTSSNSCGSVLQPTCYVPTVSNSGRHWGTRQNLSQLDSKFLAPIISQDDSPISYKKPANKKSLGSSTTGRKIGLNYQHHNRPRCHKHRRASDQHLPNYQQYYKQSDACFCQHLPNETYGIVLRTCPCWDPPIPSYHSNHWLYKYVDQRHCQCALNDCLDSPFFPHCHLACSCQPLMESKEWDKPVYPSTRANFNPHSSTNITSGINLMHPIVERMAETVMKPINVACEFISNLASQCNPKPSRQLLPRTSPIHFCPQRSKGNQHICVCTFDNHGTNASTSYQKGAYSHPKVVFRHS